MFIPEEPLFRSCNYFGKLLRGPFLNGRPEGAVSLPEESVHNMQTYYYWLLYGNAYLMDMFVDKFDLLIELWKFGHSIDQKEFKNEIMQIISASFVRFFGTKRKESVMPTLKFYFNQAPHPSQLEEIIIEAIAYAVLHEHATAPELKDLMDKQVNQNMYIGCLQKHAQNSVRDTEACFMDPDFFV